ncbi:peptide chain release factor N(5)-glutamine methyltransferase [Pontiella sulfatireligans]|uniref:Release factor glutamine methyltransferase n=1 Tax=Pontiella sulfatireligans TaxID=2750658 RepID=A0A6C2UQE3_9BACT|nr:peptide chain release factor N(5)-glutamine methyltransferase [Pontiella sulfatireligans]VGO21226.1 Release factor glutamine methyltransferase [Pontiella sulfatireligans]
MNITQLVESFEFRFKASGVDNPKRVAEEMIAHVFSCRPLEIYTGAAPQASTTAEKFDIIRKLEPLAERIEKGEPLQYVVGHVDFWGLQIKCDPRALIPRPETELLVEEVLSSKIWDNKPATVVEVGTGTGCIVLTLANQRSDANFKAVDISPDALELARENALAHNLENRILWMENHLLERFAPASADAVVANLPYIATADWKQLSPSVRDHEPQLALDSGPSGMELIAELATQSRYVLVPGGMLFLEFGFDQGESVRQCLEKLGYRDIQIKHDLAGHDRIAIAKNP